MNPLLLPCLISPQILCFPFSGFIPPSLLRFCFGLVLNIIRLLEKYDLLLKTLRWLPPSLWAQFQAPDLVHTCLPRLQVSCPITSTTQKAGLSQGRPVLFLGLVPRLLAVTALAVFTLFLNESPPASPPLCSLTRPPPISHCS